METKIIHITKENIEATAKEAADVWAQGGLVAFPTETVYGLGGNGLNKEASKKIYAAKGRPSDNPLILHIADMEQFYPLIKTDNAKIIARAEALADVFWPGPLTMIFKKSDLVPYETTGGLETVAVRMPSDKIARAFIKASGGFVAAPSANISGRPSPTVAKYVIEDMDGRIDMIIDGGTVDIGLESTIVDMTSGTPMILRPGYITEQMLERLLGRVELDRTLYDDNCGLAPKAPGMKYRHYAPKGDLTIVNGSSKDVVSFINEQCCMAGEQGKRTGVIGTADTVGRYRADSIKNAGNREDELSVANRLYTILREFDDENVDVMFSESFEDTGIGQAVMNRLLKAAGHHVINL